MIHFFNLNFPTMGFYGKLNVVNFERVIPTIKFLLETTLQLVCQHFQIQK